MKEDWKECKLGEVCNISSSKRIFAEEYTTEGIPFYRGKEIIEKRNKISISSELFISYERFEEIKTKFSVPKIGDILLTSVGTIGVPWLVNEENFYFKDGNLTWLRCNNKFIHSPFLYYWLESDYSKNQINAKCIGSTQKALTIDTLCKFEITLPPLATQQKIAQILSSLDDKIELNNKINDNLEQQAQAIFKSWFVDFEPFGGVMPEGWRMGKLSEIGTIVGGSTPSKAKSEYYAKKGIAWITPKDLSNDKSKFISHGEIDITEQGFKNCSAIKMPKGTILYSSRAPIGYIAIAKNELTTNQGFKSVIPNDDIGNAYIYYFLKSNFDLIDSMASGSTFKEISGTAMKNIPILIPDEKTLLEFQSFSSGIFDEQEKLEEENQKLASLRDTLLPKLMNGEIEVDEVKV